MAVLSSRNALLNGGRLNAFRLNYVDAALAAKRAAILRVTLDGVPLRVRWQTLSIRDVINDAPNTCRLVVDAETPPTVGKRLRVTLGVDPQYLLFAGPLQASNQSYAGRAATLEKAWDCEAVDDTNRADWRRPFGAWEGVSASQLAADLVAQFAPGFTAAAVQAGLPPVTVYLDGSERMNGALRQVAKLIGGYFYWDDLTLHLFTSAEAGATPDPITGAAGQLLDDPRISYASDDAQIRTRCYGKGHAEATLAEVPAGAAQVPIANAIMFDPAGGRAISEWQRLAYTGIALGDAGALVGPGVTPAAAPVATLATGTGIDSGAHAYAFTWVTASGETLPSPLAAVTHGAIAAPTAAPVFLGHGGPTGTNDAGDPGASGVWKPGDTVEIGYAYSTANNTTQMTAISPTISVVAVAASGLYPSGQPAKALYVQLAYSSDPRVVYMHIWYRINGGGWWWWQGLANHVPPSFGSTFPFTMSNGNIYAASGATPPAGALNFNQTAMTGIAVGPAAVTARKVYRTVAGQAILKLLTTIANNTATTYTDATADASLGATAPAADTSGLSMPNGTVPAGSTSIVVSSTGWALSGGGWAVLGNGDQVVRYTGVSGNAIAGVPASGPGSLRAPVNYNATINGAPMLIGVTGITATIREGAPVNLWVQVDDAAAQSAYATRTGTDGIVENLIADERRGLPSLTALCQADLQMYARPIVTIRYACFDPKTKSGKPVRVTLPALGIDQTLTIQDVTIDTINNRMRFTATASSVRQSLDDIFRRLVGTLDEGF